MNLEPGGERVEDEKDEREREGRTGGRGREKGRGREVEARPALERHPLRPWCALSWARPSRDGPTGQRMAGYTSQSPPAAAATEERRRPNLDGVVFWLVAPLLPPLPSTHRLRLSESFFNASFALQNTLSGTKVTYYRRVRAGQLNEN